jgi:hypothetical protein
MANPSYVLGHSRFEFERLTRQESLIGRATREYLENAGIAPSHARARCRQRYAVAFLAAEFVGPSGLVIGTDLAPAGVAGQARLPLRVRLGRFRSAKVIQPNDLRTTVRCDRRSPINLGDQMMQAATQSWLNIP